MSANEDMIERMIKMIVDMDDWEGLNLTHGDGPAMSFDEWCEVVDEYNNLLAEVNRLRKGIMFFLETDKQPSRSELLELIG
jgi:hypothetical protein